MTDWEAISAGAFQRFTCDPPPVGVSFQVLREEWTEESGIAYRTIHEVRIVDGSIAPEEPHG
jgi:hypothetical protein